MKQMEIYAISIRVTRAMLFLTSVMFFYDNVYICSLFSDLTLTGYGLTGTVKLNPKLRLWAAIEVGN